MPEANSSTTDDVETNSGVPDLSRRTILHGAAATGALLLGAGTAAGNGQGGQAVVKKSDFEAETQFTIVEGPFGEENDQIDFQCNGQGRKISFPHWKFTYVDDGDSSSETGKNGDSSPKTRKLYTRDNQIKTGVTYRWTGKEKDCEEYVQTGFSAGGT